MSEYTEENNPSPIPLDDDNSEVPQDAPAQEPDPEVTQIDQPPPQTVAPESGEIYVGRAAHVVAGKVSNLLVVRVDSDGNVHDFEVDEGTLVVLDELSPVNMGWDYDSESGEFSEPVTEDVEEAPVEDVEEPTE